jgi:hypothetical protein
MDHAKTAMPSIQAVTESAWQKLAATRIYFGHQSVGYNILDGVGDLMRETTGLRLRIVEIANPSEITGPMLAHSKLGRNTDPQSKVDAFAEMMAKGAGTGTDIAFVKFCYVDVNAQTDVARVFAAYKNSMVRIETAYPHVRFVHFTPPLTVPKTTLKTRIKAMMGKSDIWEYNDDIKRNEFNALLRRQYGSTGRLFDMAAVESTYPDGRPCTFRVAGRTYESLVPEYTTDGGHLNERGRRAVAAQLLVFLAGLTGK